MILQKGGESETIFTHWFFEFGNPVYFADTANLYEDRNVEFVFCQVDVPIDGMTLFEEGVSIEILWGWVDGTPEWVS